MSSAQTALDTAFKPSRIRTWWNVYAGGYSTTHSFEQHVMQWQVMHLERYRQRLRTLSLLTHSGPPLYTRRTPR